MPSTVNDETFMKLALAEAQVARQRGEIPVGAVIVEDSKVVARAHNERETSGDPTAHAEILALRRAAEKRGNWRLDGMTIYVTLEPCPMCAGALVWARLDRVVYGAPDERAGAVHSLFNIPADPRLNHQLEIESGVLPDESAELLQQFFKQRRRKFRFL